ncbi:MAG: class I SAM-dependent methyltransferase [Actinomycetota bacterium]|nr:class I SAM-dependent methyltransferase [Actinomycetota bacterium]
MADEVDIDAQRDRFVEHLLGAVAGGIEILCVYVGDQLGLYRALAAGGPQRAAELAAAASVNARYAREWLEQQAMCGVVAVDDERASAQDRRYSLPPAHAEVLLDEKSLAYLAPMAQLVVACARPLDALLEAFRSGTGVPYASYGADLHEGQGRSTRPLFESLLATRWLPAVPRIHERLQANPPARVADVACGLGYSSQAIARGYTKVLVDGIDLDEASVARARELLEGSDVAERVTFHHRDAAEIAFAGRYDLVTIFEALHDMAHPTAVLRTLRGMLADGGSVLIGDERTAERFSLDAGDQERLYYGFSVLHCLPVGMTEPDSAGTGTLIRPDIVRDYATEAGFVDVRVLPIEHDLWRFYLLSS